VPTTRRILVTGATGKVGVHFTQRLLADPRQGGTIVRALCHQRTLPPTPRIEVVRGSIADRAFVREAMRDVTHVLHLATCK
jgi:UDP-glucose 4-epimerase